MAMAPRASLRNAIAISNRPGWRDVARLRWCAFVAGRLGRALDAFDVVLGACALRALLAHWHPSPTAAGVLLAVALVAERVRGRGDARRPGHPRGRVTASPR